MLCDVAEVVGGELLPKVWSLLSDDHQFDDLLRRQEEAVVVGEDPKAEELLTELPELLRLRKGVHDVLHVKADLIGRRRHVLWGVLFSHYELLQILLHLFQVLQLPNYA